MLPSSLPVCLSILGLLLSWSLMVLLFGRLGKKLLGERVGEVVGDLGGICEAGGDLSSAELGHHP